MRAKIKVIVAMLIFGSIGIFVRNISLSSAEIALLRAAIGSVFLIGSFFFFRQKLSSKAIRNNILLLVFSGAALGINWILLFEAYEYTSIANATLSYYFAPIFVIILAPSVLKERLTPVKVVSVFVAMLGLYLIVKYGNGAGQNGANYTYNHTIGIVYGLLAALFYAAVTLLNKLMKKLPGFDTTLVQLICVVVVLLPYVLIKGGLGFSGINAGSAALVLIVGIIHTGVAYLLYFTAIKDLKGQTIAVLSYIDPISAVVMAAIVLGETFDSAQAVGGILVLGSAFLSEKLRG